VNGERSIIIGGTTILGSTVAGSIIGAGYGLISGLVDQTAFTPWLSLAGGLLGALVGFVSSGAGAAAYAVTSATSQSATSARLIAALTTGAVAAVVILLAAGSFLVGAGLISTAAGVTAAVLAWVAVPLIHRACERPSAA
jgi:hypothetical protein